MAKTKKAKSTGKGVQADVRSKYFDELEKAPTANRADLNRWADYAELICLAHKDGQVSASDVIDWAFLRAHDFREASEDDSQEQDALEDESVGERATRRAEVPDRWHTDAEGWFRFLEKRAQRYGKSYPFAFVDGELHLKKQARSRAQSLYLFLLCCSSLNHFGKANENLLANCFELLCSDIFRAIVSTKSECYLFGTNQFNTNGPFAMGTTLWDKIHSLAQLLDETVHANVTRKAYPATNRGDGGLDLVAVFPTPDRQPSKLILMAQCACGKDWKKKQPESGFDRWARKFTLATRPANVMFIPYCFRDSSGAWENPADIEMTFLVDRSRILSYLGSKYGGLSKLACHSLLESVLSFKEGAY